MSDTTRSRAILATASRLFAARGYSRTTTAEIARELKALASRRPAKVPRRKGSSPWIRQPARRPVPSPAKALRDTGSAVDCPLANTRPSPAVTRSSHTIDWRPL